MTRNTRTKSRSAANTRKSSRISWPASSPPIRCEALRSLLEQIGTQPLIVRSSSLLEDNFGTSFAGKYESHFCPNQGTPEENLQRPDPGHPAHLCQHLQPRCPALPAQQGPAGLRRAHGDPDPGGARRALRALLPAARRRGGLQPQPVPLVAADPPRGRLCAPGVGAGHAGGGPGGQRLPAPGGAQPPAAAPRGHAQS